MYKYVRYTILLFLLFISSCSNKKDQIYYQRWFANNHRSISSSTMIEDVVYEIQYLPKDYLACKELSFQKTDAQKFNEIKSSYGDLSYYRLSISIDNFNDEPLKYQLDSKEEYYHRLSYCSFQMQSDLVQVSAGDTTNCNLFHFERNYGISPKLDFLIGFESNQIGNQTRTVLFNDRIFKHRTILLSIDKNALNKIPNINI